MKIMFIKKCYVKGRLWDAGEIVEVDNAADFEGVARILDEPKVEAEPKVEPKAKPVIKTPLKKGLKK